jgi:hypothetical protein
MRLLKKALLLGCGALAFTLVALAGMIAITLGYMCGDSESMREKSPDHPLDAVITCSSCGSWDVGLWRVYIVPTGQTRLDRDGLVAESQSFPAVNWSGDTLNIHGFGLQDPVNARRPFYRPLFYYDCPWWSFHHDECWEIFINVIH